MTVLALPLLLYWAFPTRNFYWDGVSFAIDIEKRLPAAALIHPNHLLYSLWGAWLHRLALSIRPDSRALFVMERANCLLAEACVLLFYKLLRMRNVPVSFALAGALLFGFSGTWCKFASNADAYVPSVLFLLAAAVFLEGQRTALGGLANAGAMLFHELAILFLPAALIRLRKSPRAMAVYSATALLPVTVAYRFAYQASATRASFMSWLTSHSPDSTFSFRIVTDCLLTLKGTFQLFLGGKPEEFVFAWPSFVAVAAVAFAFALVLFSRRAVLDAPSVQPPLAFPLAWCAIYVAFLFFWMPQNAFYRLFYLAPLLLIILTKLPNSGRARTSLGLFTLVVMLWNFVFLVYPQSRTEYNVPFRFAISEHEKWPPGTPIIFHRFHPDLWTISYFNPQVAWISMDQMDVKQLDQDLEYAHKENKPLFLEGGAYQFVAADPAGRQWLSIHERPDEFLEFKDAKHHFAFYCAR